MTLEKFDRQLKLMMLLTTNTQYSIQDLANELGMSWRTVYRYLEMFKDFGFIVTCTNGIYSLDKDSAYFRQLAENISLTESEVITLKRLLQGASRKNPEVVFLLRKLTRVYDADAVEIMEEDERYANNYQLLYQAVKEGRQVLLKGYSSGHSLQKTDRWVEPYAFIANNTQVRCFELQAAKNKTFSIARIEKVEVLPIRWEFRKKHKMVYTDAFRFSGEELLPVKLRLNLLALNLLKEEHEIKPETIVQEDKGHWIYQDSVCSFVGIGRFVLGLLGEVEVLESDDFKAYIRTKLALASGI